MSAGATSSTATPTAGATPTGRSRRSPATLVGGTTALVVTLIGIVLLIATIVQSLADAGRPGLQPDDRGPKGARAVVAVLERQGSPVTHVRTTGELAAATTDPRTTILVPTPEMLSEEALADLGRRKVARIVLLAPAQPVLEALGLPIRAVPVRPDSDRLTARCSGDLLDPTDTISAPSQAYVATSAAPDETCFRYGPDEQALPNELKGREVGAWVRAPRDGSHPEIVVLAQPEVFANRTVLDESHAAVALRALGGGPVAWYMPEDIAMDDALPTEEDEAPPAPSWSGPVKAVLVAAFFAFCLWRGRRLGRLVTEPLPVVVPAAETTLARARLYRGADDASAAARILRDAALEDLRRTLRLPSDAEIDIVADAAARVLGPAETHARTAADVADLLRRDVGVRDLHDHARRLHLLRRKVRTA